MKRITDLTTEEVLVLAISVEDRNAQIYDEYGQLFQPYEPKAAAIFHEMAEEERRHGEMLRLLYQKKFSRSPASFSQDVLEPVESPMLANSEVFIHDEMSPREAFKVAEQAEERAKAFYEQLAKETPDRDLRKLYEELASIEQEHLQQAKQKKSAYFGDKGYIDDIYL